MTSTTMELPEQLEQEPTATDNHAAMNGVATDPLVPESALDEVGKELAGQELGNPIDASFEVIEDAPAAKPKKTTEEKFTAKATKHYEIRKREAEEWLSTCVLRRRECDAQLKAAKSTEKAAAELLEEVLARGVERLPLIDAAEKVAEDREAAAADPNSVGLSPDPNAPAGPLRVHDPDAWKSAPLSALGLPPSLEEKLTSEGMDTIGRLEQRRADISQGKEKWPKGIGPAKVTLIEDAVVGWLTENLHQPATEPEPTEEQLKQAIVARAKQLNTGDAGCLDHVGPTEAEFQSGQEAFGRGLKLADCPYEAGSEQDDWLRGWIYGNELQRGETVSSDLGDL